jgi:hypothetical protein
MVAPKPKTAQLTDIDLCHLTPPSRSRSGSSSATHVRSGRASSTRCARTGLCSRSATRSRATSRRPSCRRSSRSPVALRFDGRRIPRRGGSATARARFRSRVSFPEPSQRARHLRAMDRPVIELRDRPVSRRSRRTPGLIARATACRGSGRRSPRPERHRPVAPRSNSTGRSGWPTSATGPRSC